MLLHVKCLKSEIINKTENMFSLDKTITLLLKTEVLISYEWIVKLVDYIML